MTSPIIAAYLRKLSDLGLDKVSIQGKRSSSSFENQGRATLACAADVHLVPADFHQLARRLRGRLAKSRIGKGNSCQR